MKKVLCIVVAAIIALTIIPEGRAPGTPYTVRTHVTLDGSPVSGATVKVTLTKPDPDIYDYATYIGGGDYDVNIGNSPYDGNWFSGDPVRVDVTYAGYSAWDTGKIDVSQGFTYFNIALNSGPVNSPPSKPISPSPADGAENVSLSPTLSVHVSDPDGDVMTVYFYNASDNSLIGRDKNVVSGGTASVEWSSLAYNTTYSWYAIADDGSNENKSSTWHFTTLWPPHYTLNISISPEGGGSVTLDPDKPSYEEGEKVKMTALPAEGYVFDRWSGDLVGTNDVKTITVYRNMSIIARFRQITHNYTINITIQPPGAGYVSLEPPGGEYGEGANVSITAVANGSYLFRYWSGDLNGSENPAVLTMNSNKSVVAHFSENRIPELEISYPENNSVVSGIVLIQGKASDADGNETLERVEIKIDDGGWHNATGTAIWNFSWDATAAEDGNHTISARAYDGIGYSNISRINVTVFNDNPPRPPSLPENLSGEAESVIIFNVLSTDPDNDTIRYGFDWDNDSQVDEWTSFYPSGDNASVNHSWSEAGNHSFRVIAEDIHGMHSNWSMAFVMIYSDATLPSCTCEFGEPTANLSYGGHNYTALSEKTPIWINTTDNSGVKWLNYSVWWNSTAPENYQFMYYVNISDNDANDTDAREGFISAKFSLEGECFHEIRWKASDYSGNEAAGVTNISVDTTAPTIVEQVGEPKYVDGNGTTWVNCTTPFWFNITDSGCGGGVGVWQFGINVYWNETQVPPGQEQLFDLIRTVVVTDGGALDLDGEKNGEISCRFDLSDFDFLNGTVKICPRAVDTLHNEYGYEERFIVDDMPPTSKVQNITPYMQDSVPFNITVVDIVDHGYEDSGPVGVCKVELYYSYSKYNATYGDWTLYATYNVPWSERHNVPNWTLSFDAPEGAGYYHFRSIVYDCVGNAEQSLIAGCHVNLSVILTFGEPQYGGWISPFTPVNISPLGNIENIVYYRIYSNGNWSPQPGSGRGIDNNFYLYEGNFTLSSFNCSHGIGFIEFYMEGTDVRNTSFKMDNTPPSTELGSNLPFLACDSVYVEAYGNDSGSGLKEIAFYYRYSPDNITWGNWSIAYVGDGSPSSFNFSKGTGFYEIATSGMDFVGNREEINVRGTVRIFSPDINGDGRVNVLDIVKIALHWHENSEGAYALDLNGNGIIDLADLVLLGQHWTG